MATCEIVASVLAEGLDFAGSSEVPHVYLCTATGVYAPPAAPVVCAGAAAAYAAGRFAQTPMGKELIQKATELSCDLLVRISKKGTELLLVRGAKTEEIPGNFLREARETRSCSNIFEGMNWLTNQMELSPPRTSSRLP